MHTVNILTKIWGLCVVLLYISLPNKVFAQEQLLPISADISIEATISETKSVTLKYTINLDNQTSALVNSYTLPLPLSEVKVLSVLINDVPQPNEVTEDSTIKIMLTSPILPNNKATIIVELFTDSLLSEDWGQLQFYFPLFEAKYTLKSFQLTVNYPASFPPLVFTSSKNISKDANKITMKLNSSALLIWADTPVFATEAEYRISPVENSSGVAVHFPMDNQRQEVVYTSLQNVNEMFVDDSGKIWGTIGNKQEPIKYKAIYKLFPVPTHELSIVNETLLPLEAPPILQDLISDKKIAEKLRFMHAYIVDKYSLATRAETTLDQSLNAGWEYWDTVNSLSKVEYPLLLARYATSLGVPAKLVYGYLLGNEQWGELTTTQPIMWVELFVEENWGVWDPYTEDVTNWQMVDTTHLNRMLIGEWLPGLTPDTAMGLITGSPLARPTPIHVEDFSPNISITAQAKFPEEVPAGLAFGGSLLVTNMSGKPLQLATISIDGMDFTQEILQVGISTPLTRVIKPQGTTWLQINGLRNFDLLSNEQRSGKIVIELADKKVTPLIVDYQVHLRPNWELAIAAGAGTVGLVAFITILAGHKKFTKWWLARKLVKHV